MSSNNNNNNNNNVLANNVLQTVCEPVRITLHSGPVRQRQCGSRLSIVGLSTVLALPPTTKSHRKASLQSGLFSFSARRS
jgi:hypothetical protein